MEISCTRLKDVLLIEPKVYGDERGFFLETYRKTEFAEAGIDVDFVQDNLSFSKRGTLRGLHYQYPNGQAKLVQVLSGRIVDVALDIRWGSPTHGQWVAVELDAHGHKLLYLPPGYAHGFCVLSETALFAYKCSDYYAPDSEGGVAWDDPDLAISWPLSDPILSPRDRTWPRLKDIAHHCLPIYED